MGDQQRPYHPSLRRTLEGRPVRGVQRGQPPDRERIPRQDHQALEHPRGVQVHHRHRRRGPLRVGVLRPLQPVPVGAPHRLVRVGSPREGLGTHELQAPQRPHRAHRIPQHRVRVARRQPLRVGGEGRHRDAVGPQRGQAPVLARRRGDHPLPRLLAQQVLAVRRDRRVHQDLGFGIEGYRGHPEAGGVRIGGGWRRAQQGSSLHQFGLERGWFHPLRRLFG
mmetsp:Transcript_5299/g.13240  ORF Transcript_5299/g.13240 Transcript_5299/m.13240 type:complete len:222 (-) Transcript_5299:109-774(-)